LVLRNPIGQWSCKQLVRDNYQRFYDFDNTCQFGENLGQMACSNATTYQLKELLRYEIQDSDRLMPLNDKKIWGVD
jgi:hypothetical protein